MNTTSVAHAIPTKKIRTLRYVSRACVVVTTCMAFACSVGPGGSSLDDATRYRLDDGGPVNGSANGEGGATPDGGTPWTPPPDLVAAYGFGENAGSTVTDASGHGNTGTISGASWASQGKFGSALSFDGSASSVDVNPASSLDLSTAMTLEAWVYPTDPMSDFRALLAKNYAYFLYASVTGYCGNGMAVGGLQNSGASETACLNQALPLNAWTHLAVTYNGTNIVLYENGAQVATTAASGSVLATTGTLQIGATQYGEHFKGNIDEVRIYRRALTAAEIQTDMTTPIPLGVESPDAGLDGAIDGAPDASSPAAGPITWEDTYDGIHPFFTFDYKITNLAVATPHAGYVWGAGQQNIPAYRSSTNPKIVLSRYIPYTRDPDGHPLSYWQSTHPDWVLYKCDKTTPVYEFGNPIVSLDISNPAVLDWQVQNYGAPASVAGYDAIAADNYALANGWGACGVYQNGQWKQLYTGTSDPKYATDVLNWTHAFAQKLHSLPRPIGLIPNFQIAGRPLNDPNILAAIKDVDGILDECGFTACGGGNLSGAKWVSAVQWAEYVQSQGKGYFSINEESTVNQAAIQFVLASYLMGKEHASGVYIPRTSQYGSDLWYPEYAAPIGTPCAAMKSSQGVYAREYKHGLAIVNPSTSGATFTLPSGSFENLYGAAVTGSVTLSASSGIVLIDRGGPRC